MTAVGPRGLLSSGCLCNHDAKKKKKFEKKSKKSKLLSWSDSIKTLVYSFVSLCCHANRAVVMARGGYKDVSALNAAFKSFFKCLYSLLVRSEELVSRRETSADLHQCTVLGVVGVEVMVVEFCKVPFFVYCRKTRDFFLVNIKQHCII